MVPHGYLFSVRLVELGASGVGFMAAGDPDFVPSLAEATTPESAQHALTDYVVTERLLENFDGALDLIKSALDGHRSKAAYLCAPRQEAAPEAPTPLVYRTDSGRVGRGLRLDPAATRRVS